MMQFWEHLHWLSSTLTLVMLNHTVSECVPVPKRTTKRKMYVGFRISSRMPCVCAILFFLLFIRRNARNIHTIILTKPRLAKEQYGNSKRNQRAYLQAIAKWTNFIHRHTNTQTAHVSSSTLKLARCLFACLRNSCLVIICLCRLLLALIFPHFYSTVVRVFSFDTSPFQFFPSLLCHFFSVHLVVCCVFEFVRWNVAIFCGIFPFSRLYFSACFTAAAVALVNPFIDGFNFVLPAYFRLPCSTRLHSIQMM